MEIISLNPNDNRNFILSKRLFGGFINTPMDDIKPGMTPTQIADIVSDRIIDIISEQFEQAKKNFQEKELSK